MIPFHFVWLLWSAAFLIPWLILFVARAATRMYWASAYEHLTWRVVKTRARQAAQR